MRDPYDVLGIPRGSSMDAVKAAYRNLAKKYHPDNYANSPLQQEANAKMQEINEAYDAIVSGAANSYHSYQDSYNHSSDNYSYSQNYYARSSMNDYTYIRNLINSNRLDDAEILLENMPQSARDAEWYYLEGRINYNRGWIDQAYHYFSTAYKMNPSNIEYRTTYDNLRNMKNTGYRTSRRSDSSDCTNICCTLLCADSCCECMGGDLIPCC